MAHRTCKTFTETVEGTEDCTSYNSYEPSTISELNSKPDRMTTCKEAQIDSSIGLPHFTVSISNSL